jgi:hypothetical protein
VKYEHHIHQEIAVEAIKAYHDQFELSDEEIEIKAHEIAMWKGYTYSAAKTKDACIRIAKWYRNELKRRRNENTTN